MAAQPKSASSRLPSVHGANLEGPIRVALTHFHAVGEWPLFARSGPFIDSTVTGCRG